MHDQTAKRLIQSIPKILNIWEKRAKEEIEAAYHQDTLALRNSLSEYIAQLADALSNSIDRTPTRQIKDKKDSTRVGKKHGEERANTSLYTMDQMILEYHILRQVICEVLEEEAPLTIAEREVIVCSVEQAVNDAATQFSDSLRNLQEKLSHALAHDLRNPLTSAKFCTEMIIKNPGDEKKSRDKAQRVLSSLERIDLMIGELLDASRLDAEEKQLLDFKDFDLKSLLKDIAEEFNLVYDGRFILKTQGECIGFWNEGSIRRLIENLATNALKYGFESTPIILSCSDDQDSVNLSILNQGEAIPHEDLSGFFEKFKRGKFSGHKPGWGIGLAFVKEIVEKHHGQLTVESDEKGTKFIMKLPKKHL